MNQDTMDLSSLVSFASQQRIASASSKADAHTSPKKSEISAIACNADLSRESSQKRKLDLVGSGEGDIMTSKHRVLRITGKNESNSNFVCFNQKTIAENGRSDKIQVNTQTCNTPQCKKVIDSKDQNQTGCFYNSLPILQGTDSSNLRSNILLENCTISDNAQNVIRQNILNFNYMNPPYLCSDVKRSDQEKENELLCHLLQRPARRQVQAIKRDISYTQGDHEYNIWYHKYLTDRFDHAPQLREVAEYKCDPQKDAGYTKADFCSAKSKQYFCIFFARGCCNSGSECQYRHRPPTVADELSIEPSRDVFGRERFGVHRDDMTGVGCFNLECQTIFVGGLNFNRATENGQGLLEETIRNEFGKWGQITSLRVISKKCIAFIKYTTRLQAEFAKVAMSDQSLGIHSECLIVRWAYETPHKNDSQLLYNNEESTILSNAEAALMKAIQFQNDAYALSSRIYYQLLSNLSQEQMVLPELQISSWNSAYETARSTLVNSEEFSGVQDASVAFNDNYLAMLRHSHAGNFTPPWLNSGNKVSETQSSAWEKSSPSAFMLQG
ncbi:hypothetical protein IE077_004362 [Cardiosporidium cionae]|uniref:Uncharacterized protein n=1 Tax=Cardiosporidium cionae TaxID=476202 RepID=A0ABQ7JB73_9APIC|nr:hypothetical protein IE077_004362 [Cardiosporidium cionae]|eukprot:KAF8821255.1 hypothetical protein IE077_004362 [Cardiosporidium cionae]